MSAGYMSTWAYWKRCDVVICGVNILRKCRVVGEDVVAALLSKEV